MINYPSDAALLFGNRLASAMHEASIRKSLGELNDCADFDEDLRPWILAYVDHKDCDSCAIVYAAMRTVEGAQASGDAKVPNYPSQHVADLGNRIIEGIADAMIGLTKTHQEGRGTPTIAICYAAMLAEELKNRKQKKALEVLKELKECSEYWSEYCVPIGIHERIEEAIKELEEELK